MADLQVKGVDFSKLTDEQKEHMAAILNIDITAITAAAATKKKEVNNLVMKEGSETIAIDAFSGEEFDISQLSEDVLTRVKKTGLSPESLAKLEEAEKIKALMKGKTINRGPRNAVSAGEQIRQIVAENSSKITAEMMQILTDKEESRKLFSLAYPLFIEIPANASESDKKEMRKVKGASRFSAKVWQFDNILDKSFYMTNDLYVRNIEKIAAYFKA